MRKCSRCGEEKDIGHFYKTGNCKDGLDSYCKECRQLYNKGIRFPKRNLRERQHKILQIIDTLYKQYGKFPTYEEIAKPFGITKRSIESTLDIIIKNNSRPLLIRGKNENPD